MTVLKTWLNDKALPIWWELGADHKIGGFHEALDDQGRAPRLVRRARVATRQVFVYATAFKREQVLSWKTAACHGLEFLNSHFLRSDGLVHSQLDLEGRPIGDQVTLYDQAFYLFALAKAAQAGLDREAQEQLARKAFDQIQQNWRHPLGGFVERGSEHAFQANPHMHLLEAALAWEDISKDERWPRLADELVDFALRVFIHPKTGFLREFFGPDWLPAKGEAGTWVEPGHLFEWAWLLLGWAKKRQNDKVLLKAQSLENLGRLYGLDLERGVAIDGLWDDAITGPRIASNQARLWPQTERLKAQARLHQILISDPQRRIFQNEAKKAADGLRLYLQTPIEGLWRDKYLGDGSFLLEPAPASSLYHIACAIWDSQELDV